jgi:hypothetical protein
MITFSLNSANVHNITIIDTNLRYTRFIDRKFHTYEGNYDSNDEMVVGLSILSNMADSVFILTCNLQKNIRASESSNESV